MKAIARWVAIPLVISAVTVAGDRAHLNPTTIGFAFLVAVVFLSMWAGLAGGIAASLLATGAFNYFFLPPRHTFHVDDARNWVALTAFLVSSLVVTRIVLAARADAAKAERRRLEGEANAHMDLLRQSDAFKTSLLRAASHDLTTPLTAVRIHIATLERQARDVPGLNETVHAIDVETSRLQRRIDNLLTTARLEAGRFTPHPEPTPAADLFRAVRESLTNVYAERPVHVSVSADCPDVDVDPSLALEILVNVVENAHQASPPNAAIELTAIHVEGTVLLEVLDRGHGIPADSDVSHRGLGIEIARGLTHASGGTFALRNRDGGGAVASIRLPAALLGGDTVEDS
jgi:two-component system, OmpR family, sensor histidine kinase KdpD